jgi:hypothetical protein
MITQEEFDKKYNVRMPRTKGETKLNSHLALKSLENTYHEIDRIVFFSDNERLELAQSIRTKLLDLSNKLADYPIDEDNRETVKYIAFLINKLGNVKDKDEYMLFIDETLDKIIKNAQKGPAK